MRSNRSVGWVVRAVGWGCAVGVRRGEDWAEQRGCLRYLLPQPILQAGARAEEGV